jgi:hypothetical protein
MEINRFDWSLMTFIDLNDVLGSQVVNFDLFVMRTRGHAIAQRMEFGLVNYTVVLLISLDRFFCRQVPDNYLFVITRYDICGSGGKLAVSDPIFVFF